MTPGLLTAGNGQTWESDLVAALDRPGSAMTVVRRCVDIADVLALATTGRASAVVLSAGLRRLDTEAVQRLTSAGIAIVGVYPAGDTRVRTRLDRIGIADSVPDDCSTTALLTALTTAVEHFGGGRKGPVAANLTMADPGFAFPGLDRGRPGPGTADPGSGYGSGSGSDRGSDPPPDGKVVAVWGPAGAPGRTMLASALAVESSMVGVPTLLIDADVYGGVLASAFGLLDESPGLAGACRQAANGRLDLAGLTKLVWAVGPLLRLLTGITRADRWPEVRPSAVPIMLGVARSMAQLTVIDCGFCLEADEEITFDTVAPRRNGATLALLAEADVVLAVGSADPAGMERLIRGLAELKEALPQVRPRVVLNRCRRSAATSEEAADALFRFSGIKVTATLPEDRPATDRAWKLGVALAEATPSSPLRRAITELAAALRPTYATMSP